MSSSFLEDRLRLRRSLSNLQIRQFARQRVASPAEQVGGVTVAATRLLQHRADEHSFELR